MIKLIKNLHRGFIGGPDFSIPTQRVVLLGDKQLSINIPESNVAAVEKPRDKHFPHDSITWFKEHARSYDQHEFVIILTENWMYLPVVPFGTSSEYGMLSCQPRIKQTSKIDVTDLEALSHFVTQEYENFHNGPNGINTEIRKGVKERLTKYPPPTSEERLKKEMDGWVEARGKTPLLPAKKQEFNERIWVFYQEFKNNTKISHTNFYCLPLSATSFLDIEFNYRVDRYDKYEKWSKHAEESERRIMESVTLTDIPEEQVNLLN
ncbi:hypothetical protein MSP8887_00656 [Marinomonas spartinae]|uniref:hypothetical protein n=1 Tax=Marinomonas spartinae TaxID=1792290 RepID=UPI000808BA45|nr:hypothetical protein [Marinomonas spartinae]SBS27474.1 hypothetical protein MSP8887_00656 [Marinomonas spartinae]